MAFLDNSGDIILDAVLTDTGRMRLARGDGSFYIAKFALSDDEINYELYNNAHSSGSPYFDLSIKQTPVLEAFTNNTSLMKSKLVSVNRTDLLYLPIVTLNERNANTARHSTLKTFVLAVDEDTEKLIATDSANSPIQGVMKGQNVGGINSTTIRVDQGLDTTQISFKKALDPDLYETEYMLEVDNRFVFPVAASEGSSIRPSSIDDDNIATYIYTINTDEGTYVNDIGNTNDDAQMVIGGPRGSTFAFQLQATSEVNAGTFYMDNLGTADTAGTYLGDATSTVVKYIDTIVRVTGGTTGYRVDVPLRIVKKS